MNTKLLGGLQPGSAVSVLSGYIYIHTYNITILILVYRYTHRNKLNCTPRSILGMAAEPEENLGNSPERGTCWTNRYRRGTQTNIKNIFKKIYILYIFDILYMFYIHILYYKSPEILICNCLFEVSVFRGPSGQSQLRRGHFVSHQMVTAAIMWGDYLLGGCKNRLYSYKI